MEGTPAGWYDDPEQPGQQRYWDGNAWTEQRAPGAATPAPPAAPTAPTPPPAAPMAPPMAPPVAAPPKKSNKVLWIVLGVVGGIFLLIVIGIVAIAFLGDSATDVVEKNLPAALEDNYRTQGLDVTVSKADCGSVSSDDGPFTTKCTITIDGLAEPLQATIYGTVSGNTVSVDDATSDQVILDAKLAATQAQPVIDSIDPTVSITTCNLSAPVVLVADGLTFTCKTDSNETVTFEVDNNTLKITNVS
jgi:hypothetical protein